MNIKCLVSTGVKTLFMDKYTGTQHTSEKEKGECAVDSKAIQSGKMTIWQRWTHFSMGRYYPGCWLHEFLTWAYVESTERLIDWWNSLIRAEEGKYQVENLRRVDNRVLFPEETS